MRDTGIRTVFLHIKERRLLVQYADLLAELGMLNGDFLYILTPEAARTDSIGQVYGDLALDTPMRRLLANALIFDALDRFRSQPASDRFLRSWNNQGPATVERINALLPVHMERMSADFFQIHPQPANFVSFAFDAVLVLAVGRCAVEAEVGSH